MQNSSNKKLWIIIGAVIIVLLCVCCVAAILVWNFILKPSQSILSSSSMPSNYGVFLKEGQDFIELPEIELFDFPTPGDVGSVPATASSSPTIVYYQQNADLSNLVFYSVIGQDQIDYNAAPNNQGYIEITPSSKLGDGLYCLIQGNPTAASLPGWCFQVGE